MEQTLSMANVLHGLLPAEAAIEGGAIPGGMRAEWPEELATVSQAIARRRDEFFFGRVLARRALAALEIAPQPIPASRDRSPRWPAGTTGSIAHCEDHCIVAVARTSEMASLGVDIEYEDRVTTDLVPAIMTERERRRHGFPDAASNAHRIATLVFCAKEAFYKLQYPLTRARLSFHDVEVEIVGVNAFEARLCVDVYPFSREDLFEGRFARDDGRIVAAMSLRALS